MLYRETLSSYIIYFEKNIHFTNQA